MTDVTNLLAGLLLNNKKKLNAIFNSENPKAVLTLRVKRKKDIAFKITIEKI